MPSPVRLVVCINKRLGTGQRSCAGSGSLELIGKIESMLSAEGLDILLVRRECLGRCERGPAMRIAPGGPFVTEIDESGLGLIIAELKVFIGERSGTVS